jgi:HD-GYP domain-containing protein (c-di-GMP phosphodiesterase class II)
MHEIERLRTELGRQESRDEECQLQREVADLRATLKQHRARCQELGRSYLATVRALSNAVEAHAGYTGKHAERATEYALEIVRALGMSSSENAEMEFGFLLHDIGKVAIPDAILFKPGPLTDEEQALMRRHPLIGAQIVHGIDFVGGAVDVVRCHHERWDGQGYPDGLTAEQIPVAARVFAVADAFDAMTTKRPYRPASSCSAAREIITRQAGAQFDPGVVNAFNSISDSTLERIRAKFNDVPMSTRA